MSHLSIVKTNVQPGVPVIGAVDEYLAATHRLRNAESQRTYAWQLKTFAKWADGASISLEEIDASAIHAFLDHYEKTARPHKQGATTISKVTLSGLVRTIKSFLRWCSQDRIFDDFVEEKTVKGIHQPKTPVVIIEVFSSTQIRDLLQACDGEENDRMRARGRAIIHLLTGTGLRAAEACHLTIADAHTQDAPPYILVRCGKGDKSRKIPLGPVTLRKLIHWTTLYRAAAPATAPLFTERKGEEPLTPAGLRQLFERLGERSGIENVRCSPHTCRHFFACECIKRHMSIYNLSKLLGHASVVMTERYCRALGSDFDALAELTRGQLR